MCKKIKRNNKAGFTIIEMTIVVAIFLLVVGAGVSIFISIIQSQKRVLAQQEELNQLSYAEEYMAKALRMAKNEIDGECLGEEYAGRAFLQTRCGLSGACNGIKFINQSKINPLTGAPSCQEFFLDDAEGKNVLKELTENQEDSYAVPLISENVKIESAEFLVTQANEPGIFQPKVTIALKIRFNEGTDSSIKTIQTTVSQRNLNAK